VRCPGQSLRQKAGTRFRHPQIRHTCEWKRNEWRNPQRLLCTQYLPSPYLCWEAFAQGLEPRLSRNGFALYDTHERLIARAASKNGMYPTTLHTIYPDFGLIAGAPDITDEAPHRHLEHEDGNPISAFSTGRNQTRLDRSRGKSYEGWLGTCRS